MQYKAKVKMSISISQEQVIAIHQILLIHKIKRDYLILNIWEVFAVQFATGRHFNDIGGQSGKEQPEISLL